MAAGLLALLVPFPARAQLLVPTACQNDLQGANDAPGQKDLTRFCAEPGDGSPPFELHTLWNWDLVTLSGNNTGDGCLLLDTDADLNANLAVCVTIRSGAATLGSVRLFTCGDAQPDRCTSAVAVGTYTCLGGANAGAPCAGASDCLGGGYCRPQDKNTTCEVSQQNTDPFPAGTAYPADTQALCAIDLGDFPGVMAAVLLDACSYPSQVPNSAPSDCIVFTACTSVSQCNDSNPCTTDSCDTTVGVCRHAPVATPTACGNQTATSCDDPDSCNNQGLCAPNYRPPGTPCRPSGGVCDVAESCPGMGAACPADGLLPAGTVCRAATGECDVAESCTGASGACPADLFQPSTHLCREAFGPCDVAEICDGTSGACPPNQVQPAGTPCGSYSSTDCSDPDTCDGLFGVCLANNRPCAAVTNSSGCAYDADGRLDGRQFMLLFTPDVPGGSSYQLSASEPAAMFYNAIVEGVAGEDVVSITVPYPFITQGATPLHRYDVAAWVIGPDGRRLGMASFFNGRCGDEGCFLPGLEVESKALAIELADYDGSTMDWGNGVTVTCPEFQPGACADTGSLFGSTCVIEYTTDIPTGELAYINVQFDYGLKGASADGNPCDNVADRYGSDAQFNALVGNVIAIPYAQEYEFSHHTGSTPTMGKTVMSINEF